MGQVKVRRKCEELTTNERGYFMKIKVIEKSYEEVRRLPTEKSLKPMRQRIFWRWLLKTLSIIAMTGTKFEYEEIGMEKLKLGEPCLVLMNHTGFIDMEIASRILSAHPFNIICTNDAFVGKRWIMRLIGCFTTKKYVNDTVLIRNMVYVVKKLKSSILMYPEASYTIDGTLMAMPDSLGKCVKLLNVPVLIIRSHGAFAKNPLYNNLQNRKAKVTAEIEYLISPEEISQKTPHELNEMITQAMTYDHFRWQQENQIKIKEKFRADYLNRVLYKCPNCYTERKMVGKGIKLICEKCKKEYELTEYGYMKACTGETEFEHIPDWFSWQRECVKREILDGTYLLDVSVDIYMMVDTKGIYKVGSGQLTHSKDGFHLVGCDGILDYSQKPVASYTIIGDFYWYEIGDAIGIGNEQEQFYCIPQGETDVVAKTKIAAEELYKMAKSTRQNKVKAE